MLVEVRKAEEDLDVLVALRLWPLHDRQYMVQLHPDFFRSDDEADKADSLHVELALQQVDVEPCLLKLCEDVPDMLCVLLDQVRVDNNVVKVCNA